MKKTFISALLALLTSISFAADTPDQIAADYREKAGAALKRVNETLEKATVPLIADLVKKGDTTAAEELKAQLTAKQAGEPVPTPHASAASLFKNYDTARAKALEPAQKSAISRIDSLLSSSEGKKIETVDALTKVRAEVNAGHLDLAQTNAIPQEWTYHRTLTSEAEATVWLNPDGTFLMQDGQEKKTGKWKLGKEPNTLIINYAVNGSVWKVSINGDLATVDRPDIKEIRYFRLKK